MYYVYGKEIFKRLALFVHTTRQLCKSDYQNTLIIEHGMLTKRGSTVHCLCTTKIRNYVLSALYTRVSKVYLLHSQPQIS